MLIKSRKWKHEFNKYSITKEKEVRTEESECKYENTESTSSDAAKKGPLNVVFITLIFDESHFLDDSKKTATIAFYFEPMK